MEALVVYSFDFLIAETGAEEGKEQPQLTEADIKALEDKHSTARDAALQDVTEDDIKGLFEEWSTYSQCKGTVQF